VRVQRASVVEQKELVLSASLDRFDARAPERATASWRNPSAQCRMEYVDMCNRLADRRCAQPTDSALDLW
jgi:hypothetical protein